MSSHGPYIRVDGLRHELKLAKASRDELLCNSCQF